MTTYENASTALPDLLRRVLVDGQLTESRNGRTKELTMQHITLTNPDPYITTPGRGVSLPAQIAETMWLLAGRNDIEWLSHYLPRAAEFSDDGKTWRGGYGPRLRSWIGLDNDVDQLAHVVHLLKEDPTTRRAVLAIYDPAIDTEPGKDIPCNNWVHLLPRDGVLHAHVAIRSNDLMWGWSGINAFEWTNLLSIVAGLTGLQRGGITFSISSLHLYEPYWDKARRIFAESQDAVPRIYEASPEFSLPAGNVSRLDLLVERWFRVEALIRDNDPVIMSEIRKFPEPLLQSWLYVLQAWHSNNLGFAAEYKGTSLFAALVASPKRKKPEPATIDAPGAPIRVNRAAFTDYVTRLHAEKNAAYGDSWKKRGEMLGIMANLARKVDRLGATGGGDTAADTAVDLLVYLIKYSLWLRQHAGAQDAPTEGKSHVSAVEFHLNHLQQSDPRDDLTVDQLEDELTRNFNYLEGLVEEKRASRGDQVLNMIELAYPLAVRLWGREELQAKWRAGNATRPFNGYADLEEAK